MFFWTLFSTSLAVVVTLKIYGQQSVSFCITCNSMGTKTMVEELKTTTAALGAIHQLRFQKIQLILTPFLCVVSLSHRIYVAYTYVLNQGYLRCPFRRSRLWTPSFIEKGEAGRKGWAKAGHFDAVPNDHETPTSFYATVKSTPCSVHRSSYVVMATNVNVFHSNILLPYNPKYP